MLQIEEFLGTTYKSPRVHHLLFFYKIKIKLHYKSKKNAYQHDINSYLFFIWPNIATMLNIKEISGFLIYSKAHKTFPFIFLLEIALDFFFSQTVLYPWIINSFLYYFYNGYFKNFVLKFKFFCANFYNWKYQLFYK